ncbi:uncharacterized protein K452DRAFT_138377 [Aplosporella prunicola CBS 121167]|uniref:Uncharacterized protein n=1 Tax=Aplosporella prunicola CBS 121167 TaxID=1176127 RepID=A0A6A6AWN8_9PEZI|nr:uncharacterized protein K452DRAFT_138377 [Aplosporella prunicola CBS 121167]KAF2136359.1 hypothetical protein K452DRAFT_138377 [Aplosporella prunicola CBS 121167]
MQPSVLPSPDQDQDPVPYLTRKTHPCTDEVIHTPPRERAATCPKRQLVAAGPAGGDRIDPLCPFSHTTTTRRPGGPPWLVLLLLLRRGGRGAAFGAEGCCCVDGWGDGRLGWAAGMSWGWWLWLTCTVVLLLMVMVVNGAVCCLLRE